MKSLIQYVKEVERQGIAIGHFNISDCVALKAIFLAAKELNLPVIIGVSEGEREFIGVKRVADVIKSIREEFEDYPIFLNADHTKSLEGVEEAARAGFDAVLFDSSHLKLKENIKFTTEAVVRAKYIKPDILVEGEIGYIGAGSTILKEIPKEAAIKEKDLTKPKEAARFIKETKIDLLAPAIGNLHGMFKDMPMPKLNIKRIKEIKKAVNIPLVLHGGSGISDNDFKAAIAAGISVIHINTELRLAWRKGLEKSFKENPDEITPYKLLPTAVEEIKKVVEARLRLFNKLS
jgi:fructose-bisphosphate aldolase class II